MDKLYDVVVIGAGVAGLTAGIYLKRSSVKSIVIDKDAPGGKLNNIHQIDNYPAEPHIAGPDLAFKIFSQATELGVQVEYGNVLRVEKIGELFQITLEDQTIEAKAVIVATGMTHSVHGVAGEKEFLGRGVSYCATCDGAFFKGKDVLVYGHKDLALSDAIYLTGVAEKVYLLAKEELEAPEANIATFVSKPNAVLMHGELLQIEGESKVESVIYMLNGLPISLQVSGVFPLEGEVSSSAFLAPLSPKGEKGFLDVDMDRMTNVPGLFAAGDILHKRLRQIVNAAGEGAEAATSAIAYVRALR